MRRSIFVVLAIGFMAANCSPVDSPTQLVSQGRPIFYGSPDDNPAHTAVVAITNGPGTGYFCSGTLITDSVVLTAAHCVEGSSAGNVQIFFGSNAYSGGTYRQAADLDWHDDYDGWNIENDIGLIRMTSTAPAEITPIAFLPEEIGLTNADIGATLDFSGFGLTESGSDGAKLHVEQDITQVCSGPNSCGNVAPKAFGYNQDGGGPCSGDSGGPAFIFRSGTEYVAGITSYGDQYCTDFGVSTTVDEFTTYILTYLSQGGSEDCDNEIDDDDDGFTDCDDGDCLSDPICIGPGACEEAETVVCGSQVSNTTSGGSTSYEYYSCLPGDSESGPERAFWLNVPAGTDVSVTMQPTGNGDLDLFLLPAAAGSCNLSACIDSSMEPGNTTESLSFVVPSSGAFLVVDTWDNAASFTLNVNCGATSEICDNDIDDDDDDLTDCDDPECDNSPDCQVPDENCHNDIDDDLDGDTDCDDGDCKADPGCMIPQENCQNDVDDDQDGDTDCDDSECTEHYSCQVIVENCTNEIDDDQDGDTDCDDSECFFDEACLAEQEDCINDIDDDQDGDTDCDDSECSTHPACQSLEEDCDNGIDDDHDGFLDCEDSECSGYPTCLPDPEICDNGSDDDGDGAIDCADRDCDQEDHCLEDGGNSGGCRHASGQRLPFGLVVGLISMLWLRRRT
jgi:trypsin